MESPASDFFGMDFGAKPVATQAAPEKPTGIVQNAMEFFGIDFKAVRPTPSPLSPVSPAVAPDKFDTVFSKLISQESGGKHSDAQGNLVTSPKGAQGITQVLPNTGKDPGFGVEPLKAKTQEEYVRFGKDYLRAMLKEFDGDYEKALAAYNAGAGNVKKAITKGGQNWKDHLPKREETLPYIQNILRDNR